MNDIKKFEEFDQLNEDIFDSDNDVFKVEEDKSLIYNSETDEDLCMYFNEEGRDFLLNVLNNRNKK